MTMIYNGVSFPVAITKYTGKIKLKEKKKVCFALQLKDPVHHGGEVEAQVRRACHIASLAKKNRVLRSGAQLASSLYRLGLKPRDQWCCSLG